MLISIEKVVTELGKIPRATWIAAEPTSPPVLRPRGSAKSVRPGPGPVFDDTGFALPSSSRWREAVETVSRRLAPEGGGTPPR